MLGYKKCNISLICFKKSIFNPRVKVGDIIQVDEESDKFYLTHLYGPLSKNRIEKGEFKIYVKDNLNYEIY